VRQVSPVTERDNASRRIEAGRLDAFCRAVIAAAGGNEATADAATRAMMHGSRHGVDSHGVRLLDHYAQVIKGGRVNGRPLMKVTRTFPAAAMLDADDGHGALAAYTAMDHAVSVAREIGIGAVAISRSSHFGPAGAFTMEAARAGFIGVAFCNSDAFVRLHDGASRFHGTNPIACAVPVEGGRPWLLDMATSAIPYNRVQLYKSLGRALPEGVASDAGGGDTDDPRRVEMLAPLGGEFGFKGAGLAGMVEIFSAVLTGMGLSAELAPMGGPDFSTPRGLGAFVMALRPDAFVDRGTFAQGMRHYVELLRGSPARAGEPVMAPGDREWAEADRRDLEGIPIDPETQQAFARLARAFGLRAPHEERNG
jgi:LDH2 family malate/lactate/ureidoglycolate dehydrogenase